MRRVGTAVLATLVLALAAGSAATAALAAGSGERAATGRAHIVAKPDSVMVNTKTTLTGSGFRPGARLTLWECSKRGWIVPQDPCNHRNAVRVRVNAHGRFTARFKALVCPAAMSGIPAGFSRRCFIGVPRPRGIDTVTLLDSVAITVTGP